MIDFSEVVENVKDFYREKTLPAILISIVVVLFFLALIIFIVQGFNGHNKQPSVTDTPLVPDNELILPDGPSIPDGYALTREPKEKWGRECSDTSNIEQVTMYETGITWSLDKNFIVPDEQELKNLEYSNDKLIEDILGATP